MQVVAGTLPKGSETPTRAHNPDVMLRQRTFERPNADAGARNGAVGEGAENVPSSYLILISRIDNLLRKGRAESGDIEQVAHLLADRLPSLGPLRRREIQALPEFQALAIDSVQQLPPLARHRLERRENAEAVLALLKHPTFVAAIRDEARTQTYGPRGLMRAAS